MVLTKPVLSEELVPKRLTKSGIKIGNYEFYNIGNTTLNQLKRYKIIPLKDYREYGSRKPDAILIDRGNKNRIHVICVIEYKENGKFKSDKDRDDTFQQCNDLCQILEADIGIATDNNSFFWVNPNHSNSNNTYFDRTTGTVRSYSLLQDENGCQTVNTLN